MDAESKRRVEQLSAEGWSQRAIAEAVGVSRGAVWRALRDGRDDPGAQSDDGVDDVGIGLGGDLIVLAVFFALVLISLWVDSRRRRTQQALTADPHRPPPEKQPPST
jgi:transcriptional regulator with XRE-family HTH domain